MSAPVIVVVGAGGAGLCAALEAARHGASVHLVEKQATMGGMLHIANGEFSGAGSRRQREFGINDSPERHLAEVHRISHGRAHPKLAEMTVLRQGQTVDWLDDLGFEFHPDSPGLIHGHEVYDVPRTYWGVEGGLSVVNVLLPLIEEEVARGRIALHLSTRMTRLVRDRGRVTGVEVDSSDGKEELHGDAVVLATGGYDANIDLRNRFLPEGCADVLVGCLDHATGDGLVAAMGVGAAVSEDEIFLPVMGLIPDPDRPQHAVDYRNAFLEMAPAYRTPHEIWVNLEGQRFVAEDTDSPEKRERALLQQPRNLMHVIFDEGVANTAPVSLIRNPQDEWSPERFREACEQSPWVTRASSLGELAQALGVPIEGLRDAVEQYNASARGDSADRFGRSVFPRELGEGKWYAITTVAASILSRDGVLVDTALQVLDVQGHPIRGLYAVGEVLGNNVFAGDNYVGGMSITPAMTLGRMLGRALALESGELA